MKQMTLEEKAGMCSGEDFWHLKSVERLGIPSVMVSDGPHGLRKQDQEADHLGANDSIKAVCFPTACATACSFDRDLLYKLGETLGDECQAQNLSVILGPAVNIKRSPLCGRNFEYFSEDPYLASEMAGAHIKGVQSKNIGTSIKHFAANNQEYRRMSCSSEIDERTFREIYLGAFETAIKEGKPDTVMCSYNKINGEFASENHKLLTEILRDEWGFEGFVLTDYFAGFGYMDAERSIYNGGDACLSNYDAGTNYIKNTDSATTVTNMRRAAHNILYTVVNSRAYDEKNLTTGLLLWQIILIVVDVLLAALIIFLEVVTIKRFRVRSQADKAAKELEAAKVAEEE